MRHETILWSVTAIAIIGGVVAYVSLACEGESYVECLFDRGLTYSAGWS